MEATDFLAGQEAGELGARIPLYAPGRVRLDMAPGNRVIHDLPEHEQSRVRAAGRRRAVTFKPSDNTGPVEHIERYGSETGNS